MAGGTFCFMHAADLHLGGRRWLRSAPPNAELGYLVQKADELACERLVQACRTERARLLVLAGDVIDGWCRDFQVALRLVRRLEPLAAQGCDVVLLLGNHDARSRALRSLLVPSHVHVLGLHGPETLVLSDVSVAVHGISCPEVPAGTDVTELYPAPLAGYFNLGVLHTSAEGVLGHADYAPCSRRALARKGYDYWALGHVHQRAVLSERPYVVFPGNLQARGALEKGAKGATRVRVVNGHVEGCDHLPLDVLRFASDRIDAGPVKELADLDERLALALGPLHAPPTVLSCTLAGPTVAPLLLGLSPSDRADWLDGWVRRAACQGVLLDDVWIEYPDGAGGFELVA